MVRGQVIAEPAGYVSCHVHAPVSGTVRGVRTGRTASGRDASLIEIESDGEDRWADDRESRPDHADLDGAALRGIVEKAGIIGMGGAGFPTHVKLSPPAGKTIDTLIINGAECEPYLTADDRLMVEQPDRVWGGACLIGRMLDVAKVYVAVEENKQAAVTSMSQAMQTNDIGDCELVVLPTEYPQGAEKQMIYSITRREVPAGGLPMDVGALVENVGTAAAIWDAVVEGRPLTQRIVTVTGDAVRSPNNVLARIGTPFRDLLAFCGGELGTPGKVICGGPMMGVTQCSLDVPMNKTTSGLLFLSRARVHGFTSMPCISCGRCVDACPMNLLPCALSESIEVEDFDGAEAERVLDCTECGCCAFECPAHRPLVQHMRRGKAEVMLRRRRRELAAKEQNSS